MPRYLISISEHQIWLPSANIHFQSVCVWAFRPIRENFLNVAKVVSYFCRWFLHVIMDRIFFYIGTFKFLLVFYICTSLDQFLVRSHARYVPRSFHIQNRCDVPKSLNSKIVRNPRYPVQSIAQF